jgi:tetratricopeptide (TPR) repeat protein
MAITARTILTQPAATAVAAVTLLGMTVLSTGIYSTNCPSSSRMADLDPCERPLQQQDERQWTEADWMSYVSCFEARRDANGTVRAASLALHYVPQSEVLWNVKAYNQIELGQYRPAVNTLRKALGYVEPTTGTMQNNLAWAGLYTGMDIEEARDLYVAALEKTPNSCEMIHTGLFVEFERAQETDRYVRFWALKNYKQLRSRYASYGCEARTRHGSWKTLAEVAGVGMLDEEVEKLSGQADAVPNDTLYSTIKQLRHHHLGGDLDAFCDEAFPPSHADIDCQTYYRDTRDQIQRDGTRRYETISRKNAPREKPGCTLTMGN